MPLPEESFEALDDRVYRHEKGATEENLEPQNVLTATMNPLRTAGWNRVAKRRQKAADRPEKENAYRMK